MHVRIAEDEIGIGADPIEPEPTLRLEGGHAMGRHDGFQAYCFLLPQDRQKGRARERPGSDETDDELLPFGQRRLRAWTSGLGRRGRGLRGLGRRRARVGNHDP